MATHFSVLAWRIPWIEEAGRLQSIGLQRVISDLACTPLKEQLLMTGKHDSFYWRLAKQSKILGIYILQMKIFLNEFH